MVLEAPLVSRLKELGTSFGCSLFMVLLSVLDIVLAQYCGTDDIIVGTPVANRNAQAVEGLLGFFVNTLALRVRISEGHSFVDLLRAVRNVTLSALGHQRENYQCQ